MGEFGLAGARRRAEPRRRRARPPGRRRLHAPHARQAALRRRQHRADQQEPVARHRRRRPRPPRRDLRPDGRQSTPSRSAPWSTAASTSCCRKPSFDTLVMKACLFAIDKYLRRDRPPAAGDDLRHDLRERPHAVGAADRGVLHLGVALRRPERRPQLRRRRRPDAAGRSRRLSGICRTRVSCYPNAGLPDGFGGFEGDRDHTAAALGEFARNGWLNIVGGCCGTTPDWIRRHRRGRRGRRRRARSPTCRTGRATAATRRWSSGPRPTSS